MLHTILGANGIIGEELAKELHSNYKGRIRLVGRNPKKVNEGDELLKADLMNPEAVEKAVSASNIVYLTVGLPYDSQTWLQGWPVILENVIEAWKKEKCKLAYFDNTYAYPQDAKIQTESTPLNPSGKKGEAKKIAADLLLHAMEHNDLEAVICRAPEFYGPGKTKGITNALIFDRLKKGKKPRIFLRDDVKRTLIWTPDSSKAMALIANSPDAYNQTWHLPCDDNRMTYKEWIMEIENQMGRPIPYQILSNFNLKMAALFNKNLKETSELLPRYAIDNIFESNKFKSRFPDFKVTNYKEGIRIILKEAGLVN
jgi:nucleoside-diphosphate-sugar epimerase